MPNFNDERIISKHLDQMSQACKRLGRVMKRERELKQYSGELSGIKQRLETSAHSFLVVGSRVWFVRKFLPQLCCKEKAWISRHTPYPLRRELWLERLVERRVDLDRVEIFGEKRRFMKIARPRGWIDDSVPVFIGPACQPHS